jgi:hypothetical protein
MKDKIARIVDAEDGTFTLDYENTLGKVNSMRLEAQTYDGALREARSFLELSADDRDAHGLQWHIE